MSARPARARARREPDVPELVFRELVDVATLDSDGPVEQIRLTGARLDDRDLTGLDVADSEWLDVRLTGADLGASRFRTVRMRGAGAATLRLRGSTWRDVAVENSHLGAVEAYDSEWRAVRFTGCRIRYLNLRSADLRDLEFVDCRIDDLDLDLGSATAAHVAFRGTTLGTLTLHGARLTAVDLRGAELSGLEGIGSMAGCIVTEAQLAQISPLLAAERGITVEN